MKRFIISIFATFFFLGANAQFFNFDFSDPFSRRKQVQLDPITLPSYKGGNDKLNKFIEKNFKNPQPRKSIDGKITIACIVGTKGKVIEAMVVKGVDKDYNDEAIRVAKKLKFKPAKKGKKKVKSRFDVTFPIRHGRLSFLTLATSDV